MFKVFSRRQSEGKKPGNKNEIYTYNIESNVRNRIFYTLRDSLEKAGYPDLFERILPEVEKSIFKQYGHIDESPGLRKRTFQARRSCISCLAAMRNSSIFWSSSSGPIRGCRELAVSSR